MQQQGEKVALVTGAGSGIGRAAAIMLSAAGFRLVLVGRRVDKLRETGALLAGPWMAISADLRDPAQVEGMVDQTLAKFGRLDALINNAGYSEPATIEQTTPTLVRDIFAVNAIAPTIAIARAWPALVRQATAEHTGAVIVNVSSFATIDPFPTLYAYAAAKASVNLLARSVANQGAPLNIRGFAVAPGAVETDLLRRIVPSTVLPTSKTLRPESVARVILQCVQGQRDGENGQVILLPSPP